MTASPTHADLCRLAARWLRRRGCTVVLVEPQTLRTSEYPDVIGWRWLDSWLVECKVSRADFHRDKNKRHRQPGAGGMGSVRWYLTPPGLLTPADVPEGWGLLEARGGRVFVVQRPADLQPNGLPRSPVTPETLRSEMALLLAQLERVAQGRPTHVQPARDPPATVQDEAAGVVSQLQLAQELRAIALFASGPMRSDPSPAGGTVSP